MTFKKLCGIALMIFGVAAGLYVGFWWALVGGIIEFGEAWKATPIESMGIAVGVLKIIFSGLAGWFTVFIFWSFGAFLLNR